MSTTTFNIKFDPVMLEKLKVITGKSFINNSDFQRVITTLINTTYDKSNGRKVF